MPGKKAVPQKRKIARDARTGKKGNAGRKNAALEPAPFQPNRHAEPFPVVGIGASAGGLEAFTQFFEALPASTGMAFVLVQHMDPSKSSMLAEILGRTAKLPVVEVQDGMAVERDHVYVVPPKADLRISGGKLSLLPRPETRGPHMPIDFFLRSLASDRQDRAIGVILSGTASDGAMGIRAIKAEGGITFAQTVGSAKYPGMPSSAMATGVVDFNLPPEMIAKELARIVAHPYAAPAPAKEETPFETEDDFQKIFALLKDAHGVDFSHYKQATTRRRILRRMVLHRIARMRPYVRLLQDDPKEKDALFQDMLINVTSFFRDAEVFEILKTKIWPKIIKEREPETPIRIWVPGCSTGEEAYSIAICLIEALGQVATTAPIQIFATDVNESALEKARAGIYSESIALDVSPDRLQRFFSRIDGGYLVSKQVRETCIFAKQNLVKDPPFSQLDLISCRNVLIYMKPILQKRIMAIFNYSLKHTGYLVLGASENISEFSELFGAADRKGKVYYRKSTLTRPIADFGFVAQYEAERASAAKKGGDAGWSLENIQKNADNIVLSRFGPPGVIVGEHMEILQFRGDTSRFLAPAPGAASLNLLKMAKDWLLPDLRMAVQQVRKQGGPVRKKGISHRVDNRQGDVSVEIVPIRMPQSKSSYYLVLFEEVQESKKPVAERGSPKKGVAPERRKAQEKYLRRLEEELTGTKEYLQAVTEEHEAANEELRSANEEIQSSNEELQSTNEELETAKEELQSTNEELTTVNEELANRNYELGQTNNDLVNVLAAVNIPVVMVGNDLKIRRFTPQAEKALNLIPTDLGRPIGDLKPNITGPDLEEKIHEVMSSFATIEETVRDREGRWHSMRIRPYKTLENRIEGAVVTLIDIDLYKSTAEKLARTARYSQAIIDTLRDPFLVLDGFLRVRTANQAFYDKFSVRPEETEGNFLYNLGDGQWNIRRLKELLEQVLPTNMQFQDFDVEHDFPRAGKMTIRLNARRLEESDADGSLILLAMEDVTEKLQGQDEGGKKP